MKKVLLFMSFAVAFCLSANQLYSQCTISDVSITPKNVITVDGQCTAIVDLQYKVAVNGGSKYTIIHLWEAGSYPNPAYQAKDYPLAAANTTNMVGTILISYQGASPTVMNFWPIGTSEFKTGTAPSKLLTPYMTVTPTTGGSIVKFENLNLTLSNCTQAVRIVGDVWATQNNNNASCLASQAVNVVANDPVMNGLMQCNVSPRTFNASFKTTADANINFSVYKDADGDGTFTDADRNAGKLTLVGGTLSSPNSNLSFSNGTDVAISTTANQVFNLSGIEFGPQPIGSKFAIFIVARTDGNNYDNILRLQNNCALLPVTFKTFAASRNNQTVSLKWETATEQNNRGFYVQRNVNGEWKDVAFVFSRAEGGSSSDILSYEYKDANALKTVSYYRILQVDLDGKGRYSETRIVKGLEEANDKLLLFPNPGTNGKINLLFNGETSAKDVIVYDAHGRMVKTFKNVMSNNLTIDQLKPGIYNVQVKNTASQTVSSDKFIIQN